MGRKNWGKNPPRAVIELRLPLPLKRKIERAALEGDRSANAEIVRRLQRSFVSPVEQKPATPPVRPPLLRAVE